QTPSANAPRAAANEPLCGVVIVDRCERTVDRTAPVGVEVVVERTTHTPGLNQALLRAVAEHRVRSNAEADALIGTRNGGGVQAAVDLRSASSSTQVLDVVAGRTI